MGLNAQLPSNTVLNYIGVALALASTVFYVFVKTDVSKANKIGDSTSEIEMSNGEKSEQKNDFFVRLSLTQKRIVGISLALFSGLFYGQSNTPVLYTLQRNDSKNLLDYLFSYYTGILITTFVYVIIYCALKKNRPIVYSNILLPGIASGWMWACANICYFLATGILSQAISFPISQCMPPVVSTLWSIFVYKEIKGKINFILLGAGFVVAITASTLIGFSF